MAWSKALFGLSPLHPCLNNTQVSPLLDVAGKKLSGRNRITLMLLSVVLVFLICITPDAVMSTFFGYGYVEENFLVKGEQGGSVSVCRHRA